MPNQKIKMSAIIVDPQFQPRLKLVDDEVKNYAALLKEGHEFPPVVVLKNKDNSFSLISGFHRYEAHKIIESLEIEVEVREITAFDALIEAIQSNSKHGLKYTNDDKWHCIELILRHENANEWSDNHIATICGVSNHLVKKVRESLDIGSPGSSVTVQRGDKQYEINTSNIGPKKLTEMDRLKNIEKLLNSKIEDWPKTFLTIKEVWNCPKTNIPDSLKKEIKDFVDWYQKIQCEVA